MQVTVTIPDNYSTLSSDEKLNILFKEVQKVESESAPLPTSSEDEMPEWKQKIMQAKGLWKDRTDLPDFEAVRDSLDRHVFDSAPQ